MSGFLSLPALKAEVRRTGVSALTDEALLTALLAYTEPRDAAGSAKSLLAHFSSLYGVLSAGIRNLTAAGATRHTASLLHMLLPAYGQFLRSAVPADTVFDTVDKIGDYFTRCYCGFHVETVFLLLLRADNTAISCRRVAEGSVNSANLNTRALVEAALFAGAAEVAIAHNHLGGNTAPSQSDIATTANLKNAFATIGVRLREHIIVAGERYVPILRLTEETDDGSSPVGSPSERAAARGAP